MRSFVLLAFLATCFGSFTSMMHRDHQVECMEVFSHSDAAGAAQTAAGLEQMLMPVGKLPKGVTHCSIKVCEISHNVHCHSVFQNLDACLAEKTKLYLSTQVESFISNHFKNGNDCRCDFTMKTTEESQHCGREVKKLLSSWSDTSASSRFLKAHTFFCEEAGGCSKSALGISGCCDGCCGDSCCGQPGCKCTKCSCEEKCSSKCVEDADCATSCTATC